MPTEQHPTDAQREGEEFPLAHAPGSAGGEFSGPVTSSASSTSPTRSTSPASPEAPVAAQSPVHAPVTAGFEETLAYPHHRFGVPGLPVSRNSPFYLGFFGTLGGLTAWFLSTQMAQLSALFVLVAVSLFLALSLDPLVQVLQRRGLPRRGAVAIVLLVVVATFVAFVSVVSQPLVQQGTELVQATPELLEGLRRSEFFRRLDQDYGIASRATDQLQQRLANGETVVQLFGGVFGAGKAVVSGVFSAFTVLVLTLYFLASLHSMADTAYRLVPASRRERVRLLGDEIIKRIGGYVAGQLGVASVNGLCTFLLVTALNLPYALVLSITVGVLGIIPMIGAMIGASVVVVVALFQSWQMAVGVAVYYVIYQQIENYLVMPKIMSRTVSVPGSVAVVAALAGGALLGMLGALIAIPCAAAGLLIVQEVVVPRQDRL